MLKGDLSIMWGSGENMEFWIFWILPKKKKSKKKRRDPKSLSKHFIGISSKPNLGITIFLDWTYSTQQSKVDAIGQWTTLKIVIHWKGLAPRKGLTEMMIRVPPSCLTELLDPTSKCRYSYCRTKWYIYSPRIPLISGIKTSWSEANTTPIFALSNYINKKIQSYLQQYTRPTSK